MYVARAREVIEAEAQGLLRLKERLDDSFDRAVEMILNCRGKVIFTGMGKPGHLGKKLAATFSSTGTPSFFVHPAEGLHGDSGMVESRDVVIAISNSGETAELLAFLRIVEQVGAPVIAMTGRTDSTLAKKAAVVLDVSAPREADQYNLVPSVTVAVTLGMGDALAIVLMEKRGFGPSDFARFHPGGSLGARLSQELDEEASGG